MQWIILRRERRAIRTSSGRLVSRYNEIHLDPDGKFNQHSQDAAVFPTMEQAEFVAKGFELEDNVEYEVKPFELPEVD